jgi:hypothetical protein
MSSSDSAPGRLHPVSLQNRSDRAASKLVAKIGQCSLDSSIAPIAVLFCRAHHQSLNLPRWYAVAPVHDGLFRRTSGRSTSGAKPTRSPGVTMLATSARTLCPNALAFTSNLRRCLSLRRTRRSPSCSRSTRFSSRRHSMTWSWRQCIQPETAISINRNGSSTLCIFKTRYRDPPSRSTEPPHPHADPVFGPYGVDNRLTGRHTHIKNLWVALNNPARTRSERLIF